MEASEITWSGKVLDQLEIPRSTYYRWRHHSLERGGWQVFAGRVPQDQDGFGIQILPKERDRILDKSMALLFPEWSSREVSCQGDG